MQLCDVSHIIDKADKCDIGHSSFSVFHANFVESITNIYVPVKKIRR